MQVLVYKAETANVLWKYNISGLLKKEEVKKRLKYCNELIDEYIDISENNEEALNEGIRNRQFHPVLTGFNSLKV